MHYNLQTMDQAADLKNRLQTLSIPRDQRPASAAPAGTRSRLATLLIALVMFALGFGAFAAWQRYGQEVMDKTGVQLPGAAAPEIKTLAVAAQREPQVGPVLTATGKIVSDHRVQVATKVSGQIVALAFEQGDKVERGQVLARIEDINYKALRDQAAAMLEKARANVEFQGVNFQRIQNLFSNKQSSDIEMAEAQRARDAATAELAAARATLEYAQKALSDTQVAAPIAGVVLERNVEVGDFVAAEGGRGANANAQFGTIADMTKLRVEVDISELDVARIRAGLPCTITPDAYKDRRFTGHVMWIDPGANYAKATVQAKVRIDNPDEYLRVEGSAQVQFLTEKTEAASQSAPRIWVPAAAVMLDDSKIAGTVYVVAGGKLRATRVTLGRSSAGQVEVLSGLSDGQIIAADGLDKLTDGQRVKN